MDEKLLKIEPEIDEETVLINGYHHSKYLLAFTHPLKSSQHMQSHFLPIEIIDEGESH